MKNNKSVCDERITFRIPRHLVASITKERLLTEKTTSEIVRLALVEHLSSSRTA